MTMKEKVESNLKELQEKEFIHLCTSALKNYKNEVVLCNENKERADKILKAFEDDLALFDKGEMSYMDFSRKHFTYYRDRDDRKEKYLPRIN